VVNLNRKEGGHIQPELSGHYHRKMQECFLEITEPLDPPDIFAFHKISFS
jgi:hypothetical protein